MLSALVFTVLNYVKVILTNLCIVVVVAVVVVVVVVVVVL